MARRRASRASADPRCPCGLGPALSQCCGRFHDGAPAPTAELLMRSRYSAYALGDAAYLLATWDPATRPARLALDPAVRWEGLDVLRCTGGGLLHAQGTVAFRATYRGGVLEEDSAFRRVAGRWVYVGASG
jgi:SEC-C motif-containing protein